MGWPLVWDQDEETAIQSPLGGTKIAWGARLSPFGRRRTGNSSSSRLTVTTQQRSTG